MYHNSQGSKHGSILFNIYISDIPQLPQTYITFLADGTPIYSESLFIVIGDFNNYSVIWGYTETDEDGQKLKEWSEAENSTLIYKPKQGTVRAQSVLIRRRFNYNKARWTEFTEALGKKIKQIQQSLSNYKKFVKIVKEVSRKHTPRGCRPQYVPGLDKDSSRLLNTFE